MPIDNEIQEGAEDTQVDDTQEPAETAVQPDKESGAKVTRNEEDGTVKVEFMAKKTPRQQKRADRGESRYQEVAERARRAEEKAQELERKMAELAERAQRGPQTAPTDPYEARLSEIRQNQELVLNALRTAQDETTAKQLKERFDQLEAAKEQAREERLMRRIASERGQQQAPGATEEAIIRGEFPDVVTNERALRWAIGEYNRMVYQEGETWKPNLATTREAMRRAAEKFQLGRTVPAVSPSQQARYGAVPSQAGARSGGFDGRLTKEQQRMAVAMYPRLSENEAYAKWAQMFAKAEKEETAA